MLFRGCETQFSYSSFGSSVVQDTVKVSKAFNQKNTQSGHILYQCKDLLHQQFNTTALETMVPKTPVLVFSYSML